MVDIGHTQPLAGPAELRLAEERQRRGSQVISNLAAGACSRGDVTVRNLGQQLVKACVQHLPKPCFQIRAERPHRPLLAAKARDGA